jgi:maleylacetoacetate isomerase
LFKVWVYFLSFFPKGYLMMSIKLYGFWRSIAAFRVRTALNLKGLKFTEYSIDILSGEQFNSDYSALNSEHVVPTFIDGDIRLTQSAAILEYLEEAYPEPALLPKDKIARAKARAYLMMNVADAHPLIVPRIRNYLAQTYHADAATIDQWASHWLLRTLKSYEQMLSDDPPSPYAIGNEPSMADIGIAGHVISAKLFKIDLQTFPIVNSLGIKIFEHNAFSSSHPLRQPGAPKL